MTINFVETGNVFRECSDTKIANSPERTVCYCLNLVLKHLTLNSKIFPQIFCFLASINIISFGNYVILICTSYVSPWPLSLSSFPMVYFYKSLLNDGNFNHVIHITIWGCQTKPSNGRRVLVNKVQRTQVKIIC